MIRILQLIIFLLVFQVPIQAQHKKLMRHWSFESSSKNHINIVKGEAPLQYTKGIKGQALILQKDGNCLEIKEGVDLMENFTLSFWFKPHTIDKHQTLFYQFKHLPDDLHVKNFIKFEIKEKTFSLKTENQSFPLKRIPLKANKWYNLAYQYNGKETKLYLQGQEIYKTNYEISFYGNFSRDIKNRLFIGQSNTYYSQFEGAIDEIMVFQKAIKPKVVSNIYSEYAVEKDKRKKTITGNLSSHSALPEDQKAEPKVNYSELNNLIANEAERIADSLEKEKIKKITAPNSILDYKVLPAVIVRKEEIYLEFWSRSAVKESSKVTIALNDKVLSPPLTLSGKRQKIKVPLSSGQENSLSFEAFQLKGTQKCKIGVNIITNEKRVKTYRLDLDKHSIILPIAYVMELRKQPKNHKTITVNATNLTIQIKDNSKVDGDIVTIKQNNNILLANYTLTEKLKDINVRLQKNKANQFTFVPISMGKSSGENTALVLIKINGQIIHNFSLRSSDINRPAKLTIIHKDL